MFEGTWPSTRSNASILWRKLRNVIIGAAQFRRRLRRRSMSLNSNSGSDYDRVSHTSIDSFLEDQSEHRSTGIMVKSDIFSDSSQISTASKGTMSSSSTTAKDESSSTGQGAKHSQASLKYLVSCRFKSFILLHNGVIVILYE